MAADKRSIAYKLSLGGLLSAIVVITAAIAAYAPTANIAIYSITSLCLAIAIIETGVRQGIIVYLVSGILTLAWPGIALAWPFIVFFGPYPIARYFARRIIKTQKLALLARLLFANIAAAAAGLLFARSQILELFGRAGSLIWLLPVFMQIVILLYDLGLGMLIRYYELNLRRPR